MGLEEQPNRRDSRSVPVALPRVAWSAGWNDVGRDCTAPCGDGDHVVLRQAEGVFPAIRAFVPIRALDGVPLFAGQRVFDRMFEREAAIVLALALGGVLLRMVLAPLRPRRFVSRGILGTTLTLASRGSGFNIRSLHIFRLPRFAPLRSISPRIGFPVGDRISLPARTLLGVQFQSSFRTYLHEYEGTMNAH